MRIGTKYCGGCNPDYERSSIVLRARAEYPNAAFEPYCADAQYDLVLMICGCPQECTTFSCENSIHGVISIRAPEEYQRFRDFMGSAGERPAFAAGAF